MHRVTCFALRFKLRSFHCSLEWNPQPDKYLLAWCLMGQLTNRIICHEKFMLIGALLNRTLIWPQDDFQFNYTSALDIPRIKRCLTPESQRGNKERAPIIVSLEVNPINASMAVL